MNYPPTTAGAALVIGGTGGLGSAVCRALAVDWSHVVIGYHSQAGRAEQLADEVREAGSQASIVQIDLLDNADSSAIAAVEAAERAAGAVGTVVYIASTRKQFNFVSRLTAEQWARAFDVDVMGLLAVVRAALPALRRGRGSLVATTTYQAGRIEIKGALSSVAKAAVDRLMAAVAKEEGRYGVRANAVRVGWIDAGSGGAIAADAGLRARKVKEIPLGRLGQPEEVAQAIAFLASPRASFISGTTLTVDGGESI